MVNSKDSWLAVALTLVMVVLPFAAPALAQTSNMKLAIEWQHYLPGVSGTSVIQTSDGGFLALGLDASSQTVVVKTDSSGNVLWSKTYSLGNFSDTELGLAVQTSDGYILAGTALVKIDQLGNIVWERDYETLTSNISWVVAAGPPTAIDAVTQTSDGGFALIATANTEYSYGIPGFWVMKVDSTGNILWIKGVSATSPLFSATIQPFFGIPCSIFQTADQGFLIVSTEYAHAYESTPLQMFKLDSDGNVQWNQTYDWHTGSPQSDIYAMYAKSSIPMTDGYLIAGEVEPIAYDESTETGLILKTDLQGNLVWNKTCTYSGLPSNIDSVTKANDSNLMFVGSATKETIPGEFDVNSRTYTWVVEVDSLGNVQAQFAIYMGHHQSNPASIIQTNDGGHVFVGVWNDSSFWIVKVGGIQSTGVSNLSSFSLPLTVAGASVTVVVITVVIVWKRSKRPE